MVNRTATYIAFDGLGQTDPAKSDFRYYATLQGWDASKSIDFSFVNSHDKASSVRDESKLETLLRSIHQRLKASKNMLIILSDDTRKNGSILSWEIEKAVDVYKLPLIIAHTGFSSILNPGSMSHRWPDSLKERLENGTARAIHVPFRKDAILDAMTRFTVNGEKLDGSFVHYTQEAHKHWGYI